MLRIIRLFSLLNSVDCEVSDKGVLTTGPSDSLARCSRSLSFCRHWFSHPLSSKQDKDKRLVVLSPVSLFSYVVNNSVSTTSVVSAIHNNQEGGKTHFHLT